MTTPVVDHRATFFEQFEALKKTPLFQKMAQTTEGSPWHREANVLVHTEMVVDEYAQMTDFGPHVDGMSQYKWTRNDYIGAIANAFHDTGKPASEIEKFSPERGNYRAYHGHELVSAHMWQDYAASRGSMFTADEIFRVMWMIEHHMPWNVEDDKKRLHLATTARWLGADIFTRALLADQFGRISDDQEAKVERANKWVGEFMELVDRAVLPLVPGPTRTAYFPIAPSGAGKSTYLKKLEAEAAEHGRTIEVFSLDRLRHEFYDADDYAKAFEKSVADKSFEARANARFHEIVKKAATSDSIDLYIDNTNLSAKRRKWYLDVVRKQGFATTAVMMPVSLNVLLERQKTRGDKTVPDAAVKQQYKSLQSPMLGEFDLIVVSEHNMKKHP